MGCSRGLGEFGAGFLMPLVLSGNIKGTATGRRGSAGTHRKAGEKETSVAFANPPFLPKSLSKAPGAKGEATL